MEEKYCGNCLYAGPLRSLGTNSDLVECKYEGPRYDDLCACDRWASRYIGEAQLKPSNNRYIFCYIDNKTGEGHLVVKLDLKFKTKTMLPDAIYNMTLQELLDMEVLE